MKIKILLLLILSGVTLILSGCQSVTVAPLPPPLVVIHPRAQTAEDNGQEMVRMASYAVANRATIKVLDQTGSMRNILPGYYLIVIEPVKFKDIKTRDLICYDPDWSYLPICHEVVRRTDGYLVVKGTANDRVDPEKVTSGDVMGIVRQVWEITPAEAKDLMRRKGV